MSPLPLSLAISALFVLAEPRRKNRPVSSAALTGNKILYEPRWHQGQRKNAPQPYTFTRSSTVAASLFCLGFSASVER
jgi:hypothetical protein